MIVHCFPVGQLRTNCYFGACKKTSQAVVIDPGDEGSFLSEKILQLKVEPLMIILTHAHFDHVLAAEELRLNFKIPLLVHRNDLFLLKKAKQSANYWSGATEKFLLPKEWQVLKEDSCIKFGNEKLKVIHTPGHTPGSLSLFDKKESFIFCGDLLFKEGVGRTDFAYSSVKNLQASLKKIFSLPKETLVYPGHGDYGWNLNEVVKNQ